MVNTYKSNEIAAADKVDLTEFLTALNASPGALCRDACGLWVLQGSRGYISTWGDGTSWQLVVVPDHEISKRKWGYTKDRLAFCELTQDGDAEGCFRLDRLPTLEEADVIRDILGIRKRVEWSPEELARRQEAGRNLQSRG